MVADGGFEVAFHGEYRVIVPNERIVNHPGLRGHARRDPALNVVTFTEVDGRTILTLLVQLTSKEGRDMVLSSGMEVGMQQQMELLEQVAISLR